MSRHLFNFPRPKKPFRGDSLTTDVKTCARCECDHPGVTFTRMSHPFDVDFPFWAPCPAGKGPIILVSEEVD